MIKLTQQREIAPDAWVRPDDMSGGADWPPQKRST
jgi:hypothetical protein